MCQETNYVSLCVGLKNKKVYFLGKEEIAKLTKKNGSATPDSHSSIRDYFKLSNSENWVYNVERGEAHSEDGDSKNNAVVQKFLAKRFMHKTLAQIRAMEKLRSNTMVSDEAKYKKTVKRIKSYKDIKIV